jgi:hypothetical protein
MVMPPGAEGCQPSYKRGLLSSLVYKKMTNVPYVDPQEPDEVFQKLMCKDLGSNLVPGIS